MWRTLILLSALWALCLPAAADARWGPKKECALATSKHCYALAERNVAPYGGVLASIDFVDTDYNTYPTVSVQPGDGFVDNEEWISFGADKVEGWIETGQAMGEPYGATSQEAVEIHPFYAEQRSNGEYKEYTSPMVFPAGGPAFEKGNPTEEAYNHYVLYDPEQNGIWRIWWGNTEVGSYGGGWPAFLTYQEAGIEVASNARPYEYGRQEVADSDGGPTWTPWEHDTWFNEDKGICLEANEESHAEGNVEWGTACDLEK